MQADPHAVHQERDRRTPRRARSAAAIALLCALWATGSHAQVTTHRKVQSSAMEPTLHQGDDVEISVFTYLLSTPARGEIVVLRVRDEQHPYFSMQRVIGLPGDHVAYGADKRLRINDVAVPLTPASDAAPDHQPRARVFWEELPGSRHRVLLDAVEPAPDPAPGLRAEKTCSVHAGGFDCKVPSDRYLLMGDNRDNTRDSRYLGFIPVDVIAGRVRTTP